jgi:hypothetical protein
MSALMIWIVVLLLLSVADKSMATGSIRRLVLAAGANNGGVDRDLLRYAVTDAENFVRVLEEMGGIDPADVLILREPDRASFNTGLSELERRVQMAQRRGDRLEVLLYYSGHADEEGLLLSGEHLSYASLRAQLKKVPADVHIAVLDACASGAITRLKGGRRQQAFLADESFDMRGYAFLTSSSADEAAQESDQIGASFFTHYLVSGMRGAADVTGDGRVTLNEAYQFAFSETLARTTGTLGGAQHPAYDIKMSGTGDVVMTDVRSTTAGLVLAEALDGRLFVRRGRRHLVAELYKPAGRAIEMGLEPGNYTISLATGASGSALLAADIALEEGQRIELARADFHALNMEATALRGSWQDEGLKVALSENNNVDIDMGEGYSLSLGLFANTQEEPFRGVQFAWLVNQAQRRAGSQVSLIGNLAMQDLRGWQATGTVNWSVGAVQGGQVAGALNIAPQVRGWQISASTNIVGNIRGWQIAGGSNIARQVKGVQLGALNMASTVKGWQIGLVNISGDISGGQPLGLINYSRTGLFNFNTWRDETGINGFALSSGSRNFYTSLSLGFFEESGQRHWATGLGLGLQRTRGSLFSALELNQYRITRDVDGGNYRIGVAVNPPNLEIDLGDAKIENYLTRLRLLGGWKAFDDFSGGLSIVAGLSLNMLWTEGKERLVKPQYGEAQEMGDDVFFWPGFSIGLRIGR